MKEKIKRFFIEKKELLVFILVLALVFTAVVAVASLAMGDAKVNVEDPDDYSDVIESKDPGADPVINPSADDETKEVLTINLPVTGDYVIVRTYFDTSLAATELVSAVINTGSMMIESKGVSYAKSDNTSFNVYNIYPGTVEKVSYDELEGNIVTIKHSDNVVSIYSSLSSVAIKEGDTLAANTLIGVAGSSILDNESGVHVHLEIVVDDIYINPTLAFGKEITEVSSLK